MYEKSRFDSLKWHASSFAANEFLTCLEAEMMRIPGGHMLFVQNIILFFR